MSSNTFPHNSHEHSNLRIKFLVFREKNKNGKIDELLFVKETNEHIAIWEGAKLSKDDATKTSGIKNVYWLSDIEKFLWDKILNTQFLFLNKNLHSRATSLVQTRDDRFRKKIIKKFPDKSIDEIAPLMHELRSVSYTHLTLPTNREV